MEEIIIPPLEYFSLEKTSTILHCDVLDLLHLGYIGAIDLCLLLEAFNSTLVILNPDTNFQPDELFHSHNNGFPGGFSFHNDVIYPLFYCSLSDYDIRTADRAVYYKGLAHGLWSLPTSMIKSIVQQGHTNISNCENEILRPDNHAEFMKETGLSAYIQYQTPRDNIIQTQDLFISRKTIIKLKEYFLKGESMPNHINGLMPQPTTKSIDTQHGNTERHAANREKLLKSAIYLLSKYPDECRGERKEISPEKWRECILLHKNEIPPLVITNEDVILKHLRASVNGKGYS